ncbi:RHS repeat-associated core domain-containing protein [Actinoplanes sp. NPDC000266]
MGPALIGLTPGAAVAGPRDVTFPEPRPMERVELGAVKGERRQVPEKTYAKFAVGENAILPAGGDATVSLPASGKGEVRAGASPVSIGRAAPGGSPDRVGVTTVDQAKARRAGVHGVMFTVRGVEGSGRVRVEVDPSAFRNAYGGAYASRLRLVRLPSCALTTPDLVECQTQTPLAAEVGEPLSATVAVAGARASAVVLAADADASGPSGDYTATSLSPAGSWAVGGNTGAFAYSYPISVPPPVGGTGPAVSLSYNSASQDARTEATNDQSSWIGDGWSSGESFIERTYRRCTDMSGSGAPEHGGDLCWAGQVLTLSLNGQSTQIVYDDKTKTFRPVADNSTTKIENLTGASNGTRNGEYFKVTENGTQYYFGLNRLPGWTTGAKETESAWALPVYRAHAAVPDCPDGSFAATACTLGYRFNLDYVVDLNGNAMAYYYAQETGYYGANMKNDAVPYTRGGTLERIDYGMTASTVYTPAAPEQIVFETDERCLVGQPAGNNCASGQFTLDHPEYWPDTPVDLNCAKAATNCTTHGPSFWSRRRLTSIVTQVRVDGAVKQIDRYDLTQTFPTGGDHAPALWLESIKHTGVDRLGGATVDASIPAVTFYPRQLANRVGTLPSLPLMYHNRVGSIVSETGAETIVTYSTPNCAGVPASDLNDDKDTAAQAYAASNKTGCFPVYWTPEAQPRPLIDWFYTHPVTSVETIDNYNHYQDGSQPKTITEYAYKGDPGWHYDDNEVVKEENRTWGQFRGYPEVHVTTGNTSVFHYTDQNQVYDQKTLTKNYYFLGMDGPALVSQDGSVTVPDRNAFAGQLFESDVYTGSGGSIDKMTITVPTLIGPTATRARTGLPALNAQMVRTARTLTRQKVSYGWRRTETSTFYNTSLGQATTGFPVQSVDRGETGADGNVPTCTFTRYLSGVSNLVVAAELVTTNQDCTAAGATPSGTLISDVRTSFDGNPFAFDGDGQAGPARPSRGNPTIVQNASAASGATPTAFLTVTATTYDSYGRVKASTRTPVSKAADGTTSLAQTVVINRSPASGALPSNVTTATQVTPGADCSSVTTSNRNCHVVAEVLDAGRQLPVARTDVDDTLTSLLYDGLGRLVAVWLPNKSKAAGAPANFRYSYKLSTSAPTVVTTERLLDNDDVKAPVAYATTKVLHDAMLRTMETQETAENGSVLVSDVQYDSHGWTVLTNNGYAVSGSPSDALVSAQVSQVSLPSTTTIDHDAMGRVTQTTEEHKGVATWRTRNAYTGDRTTTIPPAGGVATSKTIDARGLLTELQQYTTAPTLTGSLTAGFTSTGGAGKATRYFYNTAGKQSKIIGPDESVWTFTYNLLGRLTSRLDPDAGMSLTTYDDAGNVTATKDARGIELNFTYDLLGRRLAATDKSKSDFEYASWAYDTVRIGKLTSSTRKVSGVVGGYTTAVTGYSALGNVLGRTITLPTEERPLPVSYTTTYAYTPNTEMLAQQTDPDVGGLPAETISYSHNVLGAPTKTSGIGEYVSGTVYTDFGLPSRITMGSSSNQAEAVYDYDPHTLRLTGRTVSRVQGIGPVVDETSYTYDDAGNPLSTVNKQSENGNVLVDAQCYRYDTQGRLSEAWTAAGNCPAEGTGPGAATVSRGTGAYWQSFGYDAIGNRTQVVDHSTSDVPDVTTSYTNGCKTGCNRTGAQPHTLTATSGGADPTAFVYDTAGNLLTRTAASGEKQTLKWDDEGLLAEVAITGAAAGTTKYVYDADGNQLIRRDPGRTTLFAGDTQVVIDTSVSPAVSLGAARNYAHGGAGDAVAVRSTLPGGGTAYLFSDPHGTATLAMDTTTQEVSRQQYKPYGERRASGNTAQWPDLTRGYLGAPEATGTGYTDVGARKYDPELGRFISADPLLQITDAGQLGGYTYAGDNPVSGEDPSGLGRVDPGRPGCAPNNGGSCHGYETPDDYEDEPGGCQSDNACNPDSGNSSTPTKKKKQYKVLTKVKLAAPGPELTQKQITELTDEHLRGTLILLDEWLQEHPGEYRGMTLIIAQVNVVMRSDGGDTVVVPRTVAFVNSGKAVSKQMIAKFDEWHVPLLQAEPGSGSKGEGHAEAAAAGLRNAGGNEQKELLGGVMGDATTALVSNRMCAGECAADLSSFLGNGVSLEQGGLGYFGGQAFTYGQYQVMRQSLASSATPNALHNMIHFLSMPLSAIEHSDDGNFNKSAVRLSIRGARGGGGGRR